MTLPRGWKRWKQATSLATDERVRPFQPKDFIGKSVLCPHCGQFLGITAAAGPYVGVNPETHATDSYFVVTLADGALSRMWSDNKGVVEKG